MSRFYVGQRVRLVGHWRGTGESVHGSEARIHAGPDCYLGRTTGEIYSWLVLVDGHRIVCTNDRDMEPITDCYDKTTWDECIWRPSDINV